MGIYTRAMIQAGRVEGFLSRGHVVIYTAKGSSSFPYHLSLKRAPCSESDFKMVSYPASLSSSDPIVGSACVLLALLHSSSRLPPLSGGIMGTSSLPHLHEIGSSILTEIFSRPSGTAFVPFTALAGADHSLYAVCFIVSQGLNMRKDHRKWAAFTQGFTTERGQQCPAITFKTDVNHKYVRVSRYFRVIILQM